MPGRRVTPSAQLAGWWDSYDTSTGRYFSGWPDDGAPSKVAVGMQAGLLAARHGRPPADRGAVADGHIP
ncbi:hypothetical protein FAIPA1_30157 [Frankia sp. AiPs1]